MVEAVRLKKVSRATTAKRCPRCNTLRAIECFGYRRKDGPRQSWCRACMAAYMREHRKKQRYIMEVATALAEKLITPRMRRRLIDDLIFRGHVNVKARTKQALDELRRRYDGKKTVGSHGQAGK